MTIRETLQKGSTVFSFEFFPPKTKKGASRLMKQVSELADLKPTFVSVTSGAGGTTKERTTSLVHRIHDEVGLRTMPHFTCVGASRDDLRRDIMGFKKDGISAVLALRGDPPKDMPDFEPHPDGLTYANELVEFIQEIGGFDIGVAGYPEGHPETPSKLEDLYNLKRKVDAGADFIITQLFFDNREFFDFRERCELIGIDVPIIAGIMPVLSRKGILKMCDMCGSRIPAEMLRQLFNATDDDVAQIGTDWALRQSQELLREGVAGLHFYTLNRSTATRQIFEELSKCNCDCKRCPNFQ